MPARWRAGERRARLAVTAVLVVGLLVAVAWMAMVGRGQTDAPTPVGEAARGAPLAETPVASIAVETPAAPVVALPAAAPASGYELCGVGHFAEPDKAGNLDAAAQRALDAAARQAQDAALHAMLQSDDDESRATGYLLQIIGFGATAQTPPCEAKDCGERDQRSIASAQQRQRDAAVAGPALVALAQRTSSARVYAIARQACTRPAGASEDAGETWTSVCGALSTRRWAELDEDNAAPWLEVAAEAQAAGDLAGLETAMYRASRASRHSIDFGRVTDVALSSLPAEVQGWPRLTVAFASLGVDIAAQYAGYLTLSRYCAADAAQDANRRQTCAGLAALLLTRGDTLMELSFGARVAENAGLPEARVAAARDEVKRLTQLSMQDSVAVIVETQRSGCDDVKQSLDYFGAIGRHGELGALRRRLAANAASGAAR